MRHEWDLHTDRCWRCGIRGIDAVVKRVEECQGSENSYVHPNAADKFRKFFDLDAELDVPFDERGFGV